MLSKTIGGTATYALDWVDKSATQLVLDTRDLTIDKADLDAFIDTLEDILRTAK